MGITAYRVKQTTNTTGTGTIQLDPGSPAYRTFQQQYGAAARRVRVVISAVSAFEITLGQFDGGSPGTITRDLVLASSNSGSLISLPAGTKDVAAIPDLDREVLAPSGSVSLGPADLGSAVVFTGASAAVASLPPLASCPPGSGFLFANTGTAALAIDPSGSELVGAASSYSLPPGESCELLRVGTLWARFNRGSSTASAPSGGGGGGGGSGSSSAVTKKTTASAASVDFALPSGVSALRFVGVGLSAPGSAVVLQVSRNGGASYETSSGYYRQTTAVSNGSNFTAASFNNLTHVGITDVLPVLSGGFGDFDITLSPGAASSPLEVSGSSWFVRSVGGTGVALVGGGSTLPSLHTHVRFIATAGAIGGTFLMETLA